MAHTLPLPTERERQTLKDLAGYYDSLQYLHRLVRLATRPLVLKASHLWELKQAVLCDGGDGTTLPLLAGPFAKAVNEALKDAPPANWTEKIYLLAKENGGTLPAFTDLGGYPVLYFDSENSILCAACANKNEDHWPVTGWGVFYEGPNEFCSACNTEIESAYGDPDSETDNSESEEN